MQYLTPMNFFNAMYAGYFLDKEIDGMEMDSVVKINEDLTNKADACCSYFCNFDKIESIYNIERCKFLKDSFKRKNDNEDKSNSICDKCLKNMTVLKTLIFPQSLFVMGDFKLKNTQNCANFFLCGRKSDIQFIKIENKGEYFVMLFPRKVCIVKLKRKSQTELILEHDAEIEEVDVKEILSYTMSIKKMQRLCFYYEDESKKLVRLVNRIEYIRSLEKLEGRNSTIIIIISLIIVLCIIIFVVCKS